MAQIADAYVSIRPSTRGFVTALRKALKPLSVEFGVRIVPNLAGFEAKLKAELKALPKPELGVKVSPELAGTAGKTAGVIIANETAKSLSQNLNKGKARALATLAVEHAAQDMANATKEELRALDFPIPDELMRQIEHDMTVRFGTLGKNLARAMFRQLRQESASAVKAQDEIRIATERRIKQIADEQEKEANRLAKLAHTNAQKVARAEVAAQREAQKELDKLLKERDAAFARRAKLRARDAEIIAKSEGQRIGRAIYNGASPHLSRLSITLTAAIVPRNLRRSLRGVLGSIESTTGGLTRAFAKVGEGVAKASLDAGLGVTLVFETLAESVAQFSTKAGQKILDFGVTAGATIGRVGAGVGEFVAGLAGAAPIIASAAGAFAALTVVGTLVVSMLAAVQSAMAAILLIVVPLVAAVYSLVGTLTQLGTVGLGSLIALPGLLTTIGGSIGVLGLAWDKFNNELQKTGEGSLHDLKQRLEDTVFAATGLERLISEFTTNTLPKFVAGINLVGEAWGKFFAEIGRLVSSKPVVDAINSSFQDMAYFVGLAATAVKPLADLFMTLSTQAQPAIGLILNSVVQLIQWLDNLFSQLAKSGQLSTMFQTIAEFVTQLLQLVRPLTTMFLGLFQAASPGLTTLLNLINGIVQRWSDWINSTVGQQKITEFFALATHMAATFVPVIEKVMEVVGNLEPIFARLMDIVGPILVNVTDAFGQILEAAAPGIEAFLLAIQQIMADPTVIESLRQLGVALGGLIGSLAIFDPAMVAQFNGFLHDFILFAADLIDKLPQLVRDMQDLMDIAMRLATDFGPLIEQTLVLSDALLKLARVTSPIPVLLGNIIGKGDDYSRFAGGGSQRNNELGDSFNYAGSSATSFANSVENALRAVYNSGYWDAVFNRVKTMAEIMQGLIQAGTDPRLLSQSKVPQQYFAGVKAAVDKAKKDAAKSKGLAPKAPGKAATAASQAALAPLRDIVPKDLKGKAYDSARELALYIAKGLVQGTSNVNKAANKMLSNKKIKAALDSLATNVKKRDQVIAELGRQQKKLADMLDAKVKFRDALADTLLQARDLANRWTFAPDPKDLADALRFSLQELKKFGADLRTLAQRGVSKELVAQLAQAGVKGGGAVAEALANSTPAQIKEISDLFNAIGTEATSSANKVAADLYDPGIKTIQGYIKGLQSEQKKLDAQIAKQVGGVVSQTKRLLGIKSPSTVFASIGSETIGGFVVGLQGTYKKKTIGEWLHSIFVAPMYGIGTDIINGLVNGMRDRMWWLTRNLTTMAGAIVTAIKQALGIKSPSTVFAGIGADTVNGYVLGLSSRTSLVQSQMDRLGGIRPRFAGISALGGGFGQPGSPSVGVRVFVGDHELKDIIRTEVDLADQSAARGLTYGRRVRW